MACNLHGSRQSSRANWLDSRKEKEGVSSGHRLKHDEAAFSLLFSCMQKCKKHPNSSNDRNSAVYINAVAVDGNEPFARECKLG